MTFSALLWQDVTVQTPASGTDRYGNATKVWSAGTSVKGWVARRSGDEVRDGGREGEVADWVLFVDPDVTVDGRSRVVWSGLTFEVDGPPVPAYQGLNRRLHHYEVNLRRVDG